VLHIGIGLAGKRQHQGNDSQHRQYMNGMAIMLPYQEAEYPTYNEEYGYEK